MENTKIFHDLNAHIASLTEGIKLLEENSSGDFTIKVIKLMEKKCVDLKESLSALNIKVNHE